jgi:uncharacterized Fe-S radical SAM superfamily protein PflX
MAAEAAIPARWSGWRSIVERAFQLARQRVGKLVLRCLALPEGLCRSCGCAKSAPRLIDVRYRA